MLSLNEPIKLHNSCSYKLIFKKLGERNRRRISQFSKRKTALSTNQKKKERNKIILTNNKNEDKMNEKDVINIFNLIINGSNNEIKIEKRIIENIDNLNINVLPDPGISKQIYSPQNNNNSNNNKSNIIHNQKRIINKNNKNISNNISNTNISVEINKEINISNLEEEKDYMSNNINKLNENNEYALKFLSSSNDSFVPFGNNLIKKAKIQKNYFTESYSQALECDYDNNNNKFNIKKLDDIEIIKEEKEADTPLKRRKYINKNDNSNKLFTMRKKIKLLKEKRKSKSLTKELCMLNQKDKKNIDEIIISIPNKIKNNDKTYEKLFKKAKTKIQLSTYKNKNYISSNKNKKHYKKGFNLNNNFLKNEIKSSFTQKFSEIKININNEINKNKLFMNTDKQFYNTNKGNVNQKINNKKNNNFNKNNIKQYITNANSSKNKDSYYKGKKLKFICIRENKNYLKNNSLEISDDDNNNSLNKSKKNIKLIKNKPNKIKIKKIISINHSRSIIKNNISLNKAKKEKIQSIKLINNNKTNNSYFYNNNNYNNNINNNNNHISFNNRSSPKKNNNKINKSSMQSPFYSNKIIKINKPKIIKYNKLNNVNNQNLFQSNKIFKKNISFYGNEEKFNIKDEKKPAYNSNKKSNLNRTIFINNNCDINKNDISSNYVNFSRDSVIRKNFNLKKNKYLNTSINNTNFDKLKSNNSYYLYVDINSL